MRSGLDPGNLLSIWRGEFGRNALPNHRTDSLATTLEVEELIVTVARFTDRLTAASEERGDYLDLAALLEALHWTREPLPGTQDVPLLPWMETSGGEEDGLPGTPLCAAVRRERAEGMATARAQVELLLGLVTPAGSKHFRRESTLAHRVYMRARSSGKSREKYNRVQAPVVRKKVLRYVVGR